MYINLAGEWMISCDADNGTQKGAITLPGVLQAQGYGNPVDIHTPWVSGLHDYFWYEQEELKFAQEEGVNVPFLAQPPAHFVGKAYYEKRFTVDSDSEEEWFFFAELTKWRSRVWVDGQEKGEDCSLCTPHEISLGKLAAGEHVLRVCVDNSQQYPYRPDGHGVSDSLGATWNGMAGEIALYGETEKERRNQEKKAYAEAHPRTVEVKDGNFVIDGKKEYFRATHWGGEAPITGYPDTDKTWWREKMQVMREFGLNGIRFHSFCPPEAAFAAADEEDMYLLVECGMWNRFDDSEACAPMRQILNREAERIIDAFGHHPSFVFFSSTNEPSGRWYGPLKEWVGHMKKYDADKGYAGRRAYTAQSGWFYDVEPAKITGTDFIYFHRSGYGVFDGGVIRNSLGWKGKDYSSSLVDCKLPVVSHELGQWCAYPDFDVMDKFTGYMQPGNYKVFRESAKAAGLLELNKVFAKCSGENQLRLYKEDMEATFRTPEIKGFELLDLHDYLGQGTALVGILDTFWEKKSYSDADYFRQFCGETVLLARFASYVHTVKEEADKRLFVPLEAVHYGKEDICNGKLIWKLICDGEILWQKEKTVERIPAGGKVSLGEMELSFEGLCKNSICTLWVELVVAGKSDPIKNTWPVHVFVKPENEAAISATGENAEDAFSEKTDPEKDVEKVCYTKDWEQAKAALTKGERVVYSPYLTELNYECPSLAMKNVFWNSQMGPTWGRSLGLIAEEQNPIFKEFPTKQSGGWQWEDILRHGRGFHMDGLEDAEVLVRVIDDWNRNLPLGLIWQAQAGEGKLLVVSADLEGAFEERPEANTLKRAILNYAFSEAFAPKKKISFSAVEEKLYGTFRTWELAESVSYGEGTQVRDGETVLQPNPNSFARVEKEDFPIEITLKLEKPVEAEGLLYVPVQRDRAHEGFVREYRVECRNGNTGDYELTVEGSLPNTCRSCKIPFAQKVFTDEIRLTVLSAYGCVDREIWRNRPEGWVKEWKKKSGVVQLACLQVLCDEPSAASDQLFWEKDQKSKTSEIEA